MNLKNGFSTRMMTLGLLIPLGMLLNTTVLNAQECVRGNCKQGFGSYVYSNGSRYTGEFRSGLKHGKGVYYYTNGNKYLGEWKDDLRQGEGKLNFANGDAFTGQFQGDFMEGQGTMLFANGDRYSGSWKKNKPEGKGIYYFRSGERYEGDFVEARFEGKGTLYYKNGSFFSGTWKASKKHGRGLLQELNGSSISGLWEQDKLIRKLDPDVPSKDIVQNKMEVQKELNVADKTKENSTEPSQKQNSGNTSEEEEYFNKIMGVSEEKAEEPLVTDNSDVRRFFGEEEKEQIHPDKKVQTAVPQESTVSQEASGSSSNAAAEKDHSDIHSFFGESDADSSKTGQQVHTQVDPQSNGQTQVAPQSKPDSIADADNADIKKFFGEEEETKPGSSASEQVLVSQTDGRNKTETQSGNPTVTRHEPDDMNTFIGEDGEEHQSRPSNNQTGSTSMSKPVDGGSEIPPVKTDEKVKPAEDRTSPAEEKVKPKEKELVVDGGKPVPARQEEHLPNCNAEYCAEGRGSFTYGDGSRYIGTFLSGEPSGQGICYYANGDRYEGAWKNHAPDGEGVMYFASGLVYAAVWSHGKAVQELSRKKEFIFDDKVPVERSKEVKIWAVVVGIARYEHMPSLKYSDDDAYKIYAFLKSPEGGALKDDQIRVLIDEEASRIAILQAINQVFMKADENDVVMLYYSGHGLDGTFLPVDYDGYQNQLKHDELRSLLDKCKAKNKVVYIDACYSGSLLATKGPYSSSLLEFYDELSKSKGGTAFLMSSKSKEYSLEDGGLRQGVFSHFLIRGLKGESDRNQDKIISLKELFEYVYKNVRDYTANVQSPMIAGDYDEEMPVGFIRQD